MIKRFGTLYAGHVDFDDLGFDATPVNDRWLSNERLATTFDKARVIAETMDRLGYATLWLAEHHFQPEGAAGLLTGLRTPREGTNALLRSLGSGQPRRDTRLPDSLLLAVHLRH